ncbi:spastin-like [Haemaphysalis longicornis]
MACAIASSKMLIVASSVMWVLRCLCVHVIQACRCFAADSPDEIREDYVYRRIRQKLHEDKGRDFISRALEYDEENVHMELTIGLYRNGTQELQKAVSVEFPLGKGPTWERAHWRTQMIRVDLENTKNRLQYLEALHNIQQVCDQQPLDAKRASPLGRRRTWQKPTASHDTYNMDGPSWLKRAESRSPVEAEVRNGGRHKFCVEEVSTCTATAKAITKTRNVLRTKIPLKPKASKER